MLIDKGYHDYDYTEPKQRKVMSEDRRKIWSDKKVASVLARLINPATGERVLAQGDESVEERIQREMREDKGLE